MEEAFNPELLLTKGSPTNSCQGGVHAHSQANDKQPGKRA